MGDNLIRKLDNGTRLSFRWNGAHTVNVFAEVESVYMHGRQRWEEVDVYSIGDFAQDAATRQEYRESVEEYVTDRNRDNDAAGPEERW
jgi:hypothetical protein